MKNLAMNLAAITGLAVLVVFFGVAIWWNWVRPVQENNQAAAAFDRFRIEVEEGGGQIVLVSRCVNWFDPFTWGGVPCAADGAIELQSTFFGYVRWRDRGRRISHAYSLVNCSEGRWQTFTSDQWVDLRVDHQFDVWGRPTPESFSEIGPLGAIAIAQQLEPEPMTEHERELLCD
ncbi:MULTISPECIES: hypothetical protein [Hyphobacterium]|uniref:Uncharacterized protein n=1 Tax=Hyphobacterium vulgare TaxID=1736751 RepID=A0ABV6ZZP9_9PROT